MTRKAEKRAGVEYAIYTYDRPSQNGRRSRWQRRDTKSDLSDALTMAENIFRTGQYGRVEIKRKFFDCRRNRNKDVTLKVFEAGGGRASNITAMLLFAIACAVTAYAVIAFLKLGY